MNHNIKKAKVVEKYKVMCPYCLRVKDASSYAITNRSVEQTFTCPECEKKSIIKAGKLEGYGGR